MDKLTKQYRTVFLGSDAGKAVLADLMDHVQITKFDPSLKNAAPEQHAYAAGASTVVKLILARIGITPEILLNPTPKSSQERDSS